MFNVSIDERYYSDDLIRAKRRNPPSPLFQRGNSYYYDLRNNQIAYDPNKATIGAEWNGGICEPRSKFI